MSAAAADIRAHAAEAAQLLKTLGNENRLLLLCLLAEGERSVGELNAHVDLSQPALSQHLARLRQAGLVSTRRSAQSIHYALAEGPGKTLLSTLHKLYCQPGGPT